MTTGDRTWTDLSEYRRKNFRIEITDCRYPDFKDEKVIAITYNGNQFTAFVLAPHEAIALIDELKKVFDLS